MTLKRIQPGIDNTSVTTTVSRNFRDLDLVFQRKSGTVFPDGIRRGDVFKKVDLKAIDQSIQTILLTNFYEKPFQPMFGSNLRRLLFELNTTVSEPYARDVVRSAIERWEPRVEVLDVKFYDAGAEREVPRGIENLFFYSVKGNEAEHTFLLYVTCRIRNIGQEITTKVNMNRLR
jgi:phage baseplate assembly protein W